MKRVVLSCYLASVLTGSVRYIYCFVTERGYDVMPLRVMGWSKWRTILQVISWSKWRTILQVIFHSWGKMTSSQDSPGEKAPQVGKESSWLAGESALSKSGIFYLVPLTLKRLCSHEKFMGLNNSLAFQRAVPAPTLANPNPQGGLTTVSLG